jgi:hypothetical protein
MSRTTVDLTPRIVFVRWAGSGECSSLEQMANVSGVGPVPLWAIVLGAFVAGAALARRRMGNGGV